MFGLFLFLIMLNIEYFPFLMDSPASTCYPDKVSNFVTIRFCNCSKTQNATKCRENYKICTFLMNREWNYHTKNRQEDKICTFLMNREWNYYTDNRQEDNKCTFLMNRSWNYHTENRQEELEDIKGATYITVLFQEKI